MMQLGVDPKKNQVPSKSLGIVMIVIGVVLSCSAVGGLFFGSSGGQPYINRAGQVGGQWPFEPGSPAFYGTCITGLLIFIAGIYKIMASKKNN